MCPPASCDEYEPDIERAEAQGHLCFGMGYEPPCKNCGGEAWHHSWKARGLLR